MESLKVGKLVEPANYVDGTFYNGSAVSVTNNALDTKDFDELIIIVNSGDATSFLVGDTLDVSLYESDGVDPAAATLVSLADQEGTATAATVTQITSASDSAIGFVKTSASKRYIWARSVVASITSCNYAINYILGKADSMPTSQVADFEVGF